MAVRPGNYAYYGYSEIDRVILAPGFKGYRKTRSDARLLLRLLVTLGTRRLILPEGLPAMEVAAEAASVPFILYSDPTALPPVAEGDLLVAAPTCPPAYLLASRLAEGSAVFALSPDKDKTQLLYEACGRGLIMHGTRLLIAIPRKEMAFVAYTMKF